VSTTHLLKLWSSDTPVADIRYHAEDETWALAYASEWLASPQAYGLSPALPLQTPDQAYASASIRRFIENLLPEGRALDIVAASQGVAKSNVYGLIQALGAETTGAFRFLPPDQATHSTPAADTWRRISLNELDQRIQDRDQRPFVEWDGQVRLSVAGYQDKLLVYVDGNMEAMDSLVLPEYPLASTHILKPQPLGPQLPHMVINEHYCMSLARALGLPAAEVSILRTPRPVLAIRRFDREVVQDASGTRVRRLHIIDACQACDMPVSFKYERNVGSTGPAAQYRDGVSFEKLFGLLQYVNKKAADKLSLLRWALFQFVIGNCDAHGKNFSFYVGPNGLSAAPWYDLVSVSQYPQMSQEIAMAFGDAFKFDEVKAYPLADFAVRCHIDRRLLAREAQRLHKGVEQHAAALVQSGAYEEDERLFASGIAQQARQASAFLATTSQEAARLPSRYL
jgi:serine/threonine-protein kinase HipA